VTRGLGSVQLRLLDVLDRAGRGMTVAELAAALDVTPRRCREVVDSLRDRRRVAVTRERIATQSSGLPVHGNVVWTGRDLLRRDASRATAARYAEIQAGAEEAIHEWRERRGLCPCCGQTVPEPRRWDEPPGGPLSARPDDVMVATWT